MTIFYEKFPRAIEQVLNSALLVLSDDQTELNLDQDIFLVSGSLKNLSSKAIYEAPIFVDRSLSRDKLEIIETVSTTKILLFPNAEVNRIVLDLFTDKKLTKSLIDRHQRKQKRFACQQNRSQENSRGNHFILTNGYLSNEKSETTCCFVSTFSAVVYNGNRRVLKFCLD